MTPPPPPPTQPPILWSLHPAEADRLCDWTIDVFEEVNPGLRQQQQQQPEQEQEQRGGGQAVHVAVDLGATTTTTTWSSSSDKEHGGGGDADHDNDEDEKDIGNNSDESLDTSLSSSPAVPVATYHVHGVFLAQCSVFFRRLLYGSFQEALSMTAPTGGDECGGDGDDDSDGGVGGDAARRRRIRLTLPTLVIPYVPVVLDMIYERLKTVVEPDPVVNYANVAALAYLSDYLDMDWMKKDLIDVFLNKARPYKNFTGEVAASLYQTATDLLLPIIVEWTAWGMIGLYNDNDWAEKGCIHLMDFSLQRRFFLWFARMALQRFQCCCEPMVEDFVATCLAQKDLFDATDFEMITDARVMPTIPILVALQLMSLERFYMGNDINPDMTFEGPSSSLHRRCLKAIEKLKRQLRVPLGPSDCLHKIDLQAILKDSPMSPPNIVDDLLHMAAEAQRLEDEYSRYTIIVTGSSVVNGINGEYKWDGQPHMVQRFTKIGQYKEDTVLFLIKKNLSCKPNFWSIGMKKDPTSVWADFFFLSYDKVDHPILPTITGWQPSKHLVQGEDILRFAIPPTVSIKVRDKDGT